MDHTFLTEPEVADLLRCSTSKVKRLRLSGKLAYLPGRPVLVAKADLDAYIAARTAAVAQREAAVKSHSRSIEDPRAWAIRMVSKPKRAPRRPSG